MPLGLVGDHASHCAPEDLAGGAEVEGAAGRVDIATLAQEVEVLQLVAVEVAADVDALGANDDNLLTVENGLGHDGGQAAQQVASAVNDDGLWTKSRNCCSV